MPRKPWLLRRFRAQWASRPICTIPRPLISRNSRLEILTSRAEIWKRRHRNIIRFAQFKFPLDIYFYRRCLAAYFLPLRFLRLVGLIHLQNNKAAALQAESITSTCWELFSAYANFNSSYGDFCPLTWNCCNVLELVDNFGFLISFFFDKFIC